MLFRGAIWSLMLSLIVSPSFVRGEDKAESKPAAKLTEKNGTPSPEKDKEGAKEDESKDEEADLYEVPKTTDADVLVAFLHKLMAYRPTTPKEALNHRKRAPEAAYLAADRIIDFSKDKTSAAYRLAYPIAISRKLSSLPLKSEAEQKNQLDEVIDFVKAGKIGREEVSLMARVGRAMEQSEHEELAVTAYQTFGEILTKNEEPQIKEIGERFLGSVRRMKLIGQGLNIQGTRFTGEKFDLASLKGKVVLVDFWATWCGPCIGEIPNMLRMYEAYHDKGFEIVGLSVDDDRMALESFMEKRKLPWIILHDEKGENPALAYYGVPGYPTMFLTGPDGKVVSTHARGPELVKLLEKLLGPIEEKPEEKKDEKPKAE